jgi:tRNA A-37 threonylcarbamoyl transferase component Bud32
LLRAWPQRGQAAQSGADFPVRKDRTMNEPEDPSFPLLPAYSRLAAVCQRFEAAWKNGTPRLEDFLGQGEIHEQPTLFLELLRLDIRYRTEKGETASYEDYRARFPQAAEWIDALAAEVTTDLATPGGATEGHTPGSAATTPGAGSGRVPSGDMPLPALGPHELGGEIGDGGMGVVYRARDLLLNRTVALKMLRGELLSSAANVRRFCREAQAAARVRHPHLLPVIAVGLFQGQPSFTMPYLPGGTLARRLKEPWAPRQAAVLLEKVARGVAAAHAEGIVHRDLKPGNILFDDQGEPLVADFGLAKFFSEQEVEITVPGQVMGTPAYMSPEQVAGASERIGPASDVWALGVILYTLLTGKRPFPGEHRDEVFEQIRQHTPARPRLLRREVPRELESVVLVCLDKDPARRYATAGELADDLGRWLRGEPVHARPAGWVRRHPCTLGAGLLAALLLAGLLLGGSRLFSVRDVAPVPPASADQAELHGPIELIGDDGLTRPAQVVVGKAEVTTVRPGVVRVHSSKLALVQLLDQVSFPRFRFRGEVWDEGGPSTAVGIYVGHESWTRGNQAEQWFILLSFSEQLVLPPAAPGKEKQPRMALELYRFVPSVRGEPGAGDQYQHLIGQTPLNTKGPRWRPLCIEVTPETLQGRPGADRGAFAKVIRGPDWRKAVQMLASLPDFVPSEPPPLSGQSSLGLFCHDGKARFRRLVVEPLAPSR